MFDLKTFRKGQVETSANPKVKYVSNLTENTYRLKDKELLRRLIDGDIIIHNNRNATEKQYLEGKAILYNTLVSFMDALNEVHGDNWDLKLNDFTIAESGVNTNEFMFLIKYDELLIVSDSTDNSGNLVTHNTKDFFTVFSIRFQVENHLFVPKFSIKGFKNTFTREELSIGGFIHPHLQLAGGKVTTAQYYNNIQQIYNVSDPNYFCLGSSEAGLVKEELNMSLSVFNSDEDNRRVLVNNLKGVYDNNDEFLYITEEYNNDLNLLVTSNDLFKITMTGLLVCTDSLVKHESTDGTPYNYIRNIPKSSDLRRISDNLHYSTMNPYQDSIRVLIANYVADNQMSVVSLFEILHHQIDNGNIIFTNDAHNRKMLAKMISNYYSEGDTPSKFIDPLMDLVGYELSSRKYFIGSTGTNNEIPMGSYTKFVENGYSFMYNNVLQTVKISQTEKVDDPFEGKEPTIPIKVANTLFKMFSDIINHHLLRARNL